MKRPRVHINCAMSADGKIALPSRVQTPISSDADLRRVHCLRARSDAILVGAGTVLGDDPSLKVKFYRVKEPPLRIVLDARGVVPRTARVFDGTAETLLATTERCRRDYPGARTARFPASEDGMVSLPHLLRFLHGEGLRSVLVEGGSTVIWSFLRGGLWDEFTVYVGSMVIGGEGAPTPAGGAGARGMDDTVRLSLRSVRRLGGGVVLGYLPEG